MNFIWSYSVDNDLIHSVRLMRVTPYLEAPVVLSVADGALGAGARSTWAQFYYIPSPALCEPCACAPMNLTTDGGVSKLGPGPPRSTYSQALPVDRTGR